MMLFRKKRHCNRKTSLERMLIFCRINVLILQSEEKWGKMRKNFKIPTNFIRNKKLTSIFESQAVDKKSHVRIQDLKIEMYKGDFQKLISK
jgi:hypothetical protein